MSDVLARLRGEFVRRCRADRDRLVAADPEDADFRATVHRLAGAAGSFGFRELGEAAAAVDLDLGDGRRPPAAAILQLMSRLDRAIAGTDPG